MAGYQYRGGTRSAAQQAAGPSEDAADLARGEQAAFSAAHEGRDEQHGADEQAAQDVSAERAVSRALSLAATIADEGAVGLTKWQIKSRIEDYREQSDATFDRMLNRDKRLLGQLGFVVTDAATLGRAPQDGEEELESGASSGQQDHRYVIDHRRQGLPPMRITAAEALALDRAQLAWTGTGAQRSIRRAVGALTDAGRLDAGEAEAAGGEEPAAGLEALVGRRPGEYRLGVGGDADLEHLETLVGLPDRTPATFSYTARGRHRPERRTVVPFGWGMRGRWYLVGHDLSRDGVRVFRLDRIHGAVEPVEDSALDAESAERLAGVRRDLAAGVVDACAVTTEQLADLGPVEEGETVELEMTGSAADVHRPLADPGGVADLDDGAVRLRLQTTLHDAVVADVAARLPEVRRLDGPRLAAKIRSHLQAVASAHEEHRDTAVGRLKRLEDRGESGTSSRWQISRAMEVLPFLHASGGAPVGRVLERTGITVEALHRLLVTVEQAGSYDSSEYADFVTVHPTIPLTRREFVEEIVEPDVTLSLELPAGRSAETLGRPLRLSAGGALSLLIALEGLIASDAPEDVGLQEPARSLREKLRGVAPADVVESATAARISWARTDPYEHQAALRSAIRDGHAVRIDYEKSDGVRTVREVEPVDLVHDVGRTYLRAWCRSSRGERYFLLSRLLGLEPLPDSPAGEEAAAVAATTATRPRVPHRDGDPLAVLRFSPPAAGAAEEHAPLRHRVDDDGSRTVEISYRSDAWLIDLGLRSAGDVVVLRPASVAEEIRRRARDGIDRLDGGAAG